MKTVMVTGSKGFIGKALVGKLKASDNEVIEIDYPVDITNRNWPDNFINMNIGHVFHLAARTYVPDSWEDPSGFIFTNTIGTQNVLEFCRKTKAGLTYVSAYLYGNPKEMPITENTSIKPNNPYALSKCLAEEVCRFYAEEYKVPVIVIRPFNIYGIGQDEKFLIPLIIRQALYNDIIRVKDLSPRRDYIYMDDLIDAFIKTLSVDKKFAIYNIGSGYSLSVEEIIGIIQKTAGTDKNVFSEEKPRQNEIPDVIADISRAKSELGWNPCTSFEQGIKEIISHQARG